MKFVAALMILALGTGFPAAAPLHESKALPPVKMNRNAALEPLVIAAGGKALVPLVCAKDAYYRQIANTLKKYLDRACGTDFQITTDPPADGRAIFIGPADLPVAREIYEKARLMPDETLVVESIPEGVVLAGKDADCANRLQPKPQLHINDMKQSRGTFFAAVDFLERFAGLRFYFPGLGFHIPDLSRTECVIPPVSYRDTPVFDFRDLGYGAAVDFSLIKASSDNVNEWNRLSRLADTRLREAWHTDSHWHLVYGKIHPEYFALRADGTRAVGDKGRFSAYRCYTSEAGFQAHIEAIDHYYKTGEGKELFLAGNREFAPNKQYIHWGVADAFRGCECKNCLALTDPGADFGIHSRLIWSYVIKLARECKKRWPDKKLSVLAYSKYHIIPDFVKKENPGNIVINSTCPAVDYLKEPVYRGAAGKRVGEIAALSAEKPFLWLHYPHSPRVFDHQHIPYMSPRYYREFISENRDRICGMLFNGHRTFSYALDALQLYMMYRIAWNPDFDTDACVEEYCRSMFGPAAPEMQEYFTVIIDRWENVKWKNVSAKRDKEALKKSYWQETYPRECRERLEKLLAAAFAKTREGTIAYDRVKFMVEGTARFFEQGRFADFGKEYKYICGRWTPDAIDGKLNGWHPSGIKSVKLLRNDSGEPDDTVSGQIYLSYDEKNLYVAGIIRQKDDFQTRGNGKPLPRDSDVWDGDSLEIFLCTEQPGLKEAGLGQRSQYHQIIIDPDGSLWDGYSSEGSMNSGLNFNIDFGRIKVLLSDKAPARFYFELAIPFEELKCVPPEPGSKWDVNFYWNRTRDKKHQSWTWAGQGGHHDTSRFGIMEFGKEPIPPRRTP